MKAQHWVARLKCGRFSTTPKSNLTTKDAIPEVRAKIHQHNLGLYTFTLKKVTKRVPRKSKSTRHLLFVNAIQEKNGKKDKKLQLRAITIHNFWSL